MENLPKKIVSIKANDVFIEKNIRKFGYTLNERTNEKIYVPIALPRWTRPEKSFHIGVQILMIRDMLMQMRVV